MFTRPSFAVACAQLVLTLFAISAVISPPGAPWGLFFPSAAALVGIGERHSVTRYSNCADGAWGEWRQLRRDPRAVNWFRKLVAPGTPTASRAYGVAGLAAVAPAVLDSVVRTFTASDWADTVYVADQNSIGGYLSLRALWPDLVNGTLARLMSDTTDRPEC